MEEVAETITSTMVDRIQMFPSPTRVLLHPINHAGNGGEVPGLVIIPPIPAQQLEQSDASGREQQVGADDHQNHRDEKLAKATKGLRW